MSTLEDRLAELITALGADIKTLTLAVAARRLAKNQTNITLTAGTDYLEKVDSVNDGTATSGWPNRVEYSASPVGGGVGSTPRMVWYLNEYFEQRMNARQNTVLFRAFVREQPADPAHDMLVPIMEVHDDRTNRTPKHQWFGQGNFYSSGDGTVAGGLTVSGAVSAGSVTATGTVTGSNIGVPIKGVYNSGSEPTSQPVGTVILVRP